MFALVGVSLVLSLSLLSMPQVFLFSGIGVSALCHFMLEASSFFMLLRLTVKRLPQFHRDSAFILLNTMETMKTEGTFEVGMNTFCVLRWP